MILRLTSAGTAATPVLIPAANVAYVSVNDEGTTMIYLRHVAGTSRVWGVPVAETIGDVARLLSRANGAGFVS